MLPRDLRGQVIDVGNGYQHPLNFMRRSNFNRYGVNEYGYVSPAATEQLHRPWHLEDLYEAELEAQTYTAFTMRFAQGDKYPWQFQLPNNPTDADIQAKELVESQVERIGRIDHPWRSPSTLDFNGAMRYLNKAVPRGFAALEVIWWEEDGQIVVAELKPRDQMFFGARQERVTFGGSTSHVWRIVAVDSLNSVEGRSLPDYRIIYHCPRFSDVTPFGVPLTAILKQIIFFKKQITGFYLQYLETYGAPTPVAYCPKDANDGAIEKVKAALDSIKRGQPMTLPDTVKLDLITAVTGGSNAFKDLVSYFDDLIAEVGLGQTGTINQSSSGGSRARDAIAEKGTLALAQADAADAAFTANNTLIPWMVEQNKIKGILPPDARPPILYKDFAESETVEELARAHQLLTQAGIRPTDEKIKADFGDGFEYVGMQAAEPMSDNTREDLSEAESDDL